jgi:hypothetical protein
MRLMKVMYNLKNISNQQFRHGLESKLIEAMTLKMQTIQFVSIVNLVQIQSSEVADVCSHCQMGHMVDAISEWQSSSESRSVDLENHSVHRVERNWLSHTSLQLDVHRSLSSQNYQFLVVIRERPQHESEVTWNRWEYVWYWMV